MFELNIKGRVFLTDENTLHNEWEKYKATRAERWNHTSVKAKDFSKLSYAERKAFGQTSLKEDFWASVGRINGAREATIALAASAVNLIEMGGQALTMSNTELASTGLEMVGRTALAVDNILSKGIGNSLMDYARNEISSLGKWAGSDDAYTYGLGAGKFASNTALAALPAAKMITGSKGVTLSGLFGRAVKVGGESKARDLIIKEAQARTAYLREKFGSFSNHSLDRIIERAIKPADLLDAIKKPLNKGPIKYDSQGRPAQKYIGKGATIVINPETRAIITTYKTDTKLLNKLLRQQENIQAPTRPKL